MNECIRELARKVDPELAKETIYCTSNDLKKFAELIVRECAGLFPAEYDTVEGKITIGKIIKQHFGVEE